MVKTLKKTGGILTALGLDTSKPAEYIEERATSDDLNMEVNRQVVRVRPGTVAMGATMSEELMHGVEFERLGVKYLCRMGLTKIHEWNAGTPAWDNVTGSDMTGTPVDVFASAIPLLSGARILTFTNNVDNIRKYTGTGNTADLGGSPPVCKFMTEYKTYLVLANVTDSGTAYAMRVQWCDSGAPETWSTGNAGSQDLIEDGESITGIGKVASYVTIHKATSIYIGYLVGTSEIFRFDKKAAVGTVCNNTIQQLPNGLQIYLAKDGLRLFDGVSSELIPAESDELRETINPEYVHKSWSMVLPYLDEYWIGVPSGSDTIPNTIYKYNYKYGWIHKDSMATLNYAWPYTRVSQPTWDGYSGTWQASSDRWDSNPLLKLYQGLIFGTNGGITNERDTSVYQDAGADYTKKFDSKDFQSEELGRLMRTSHIEIWAKGSGTLRFSVSYDAGANWTDLSSTKTLAATYPADSAPMILYHDYVTSLFRIRFRVTGADNFALKQFILSYVDREIRE